jgi:hypothetical protein
VGISLREVVVHGNDMDSLSIKGVEVSWESGDQSFPFSCCHLGNFALVEDDSAEKLDIKVAKSERSFGSLSHDSEYFGQNVI